MLRGRSRRAVLSRRWRNRTRRTCGELVVLAAVTGVCLSGCGGATATITTTASVSTLGSFAGYVWKGPVNSVQASWSVPRVLGGPPGALAGTWIGARTPGPNASAPFIQIGTNEGVDRSGGETGPSPAYSAFWSDTVHGFHPQFLFFVLPGDSISASLHLTHGRWILAIVDHGLGAKASFTTEDETHGAFNEAQVLQEDTTYGGLTNVVPYPRLSQVAFRRVSVNARVPRYADLYSQWMSENGVDLAPTPLTHDSFTFGPATITRAGARYLALASGEDRSSITFYAESQRWTSHTSRAQVASQAAALAAALATNTDGFANSKWPTPVHANIAVLIRDVRKERALLLTAPRVTRAGRRAWLAAVIHFGGVGNTGHLIRRALHVPEITS